MKDVGSDINQHIAARIRDLRSTQGLSLAALETRCGVSRSMISLIERGESSPTAAVLEKVASGLGVTLPSLFEPAASANGPAESPVARSKDHEEWQDPDSGYVRRNISPRSVRQPMQIVEVRFPAGKHVVFENSRRDATTYQQIWMLEGTMEITVGIQRHRLQAGDCLAMTLNAPTKFHNPARTAARYAVVILSEASSKR